MYSLFTEIVSYGSMYRSRVCCSLHTSACLPARFSIIINATLTWSFGGFFTGYAREKTTGIPQQRPLVGLYAIALERFSILGGNADPLETASCEFTTLALQ